MTSMHAAPTLANRQDALHFQLKKPFWTERAPAQTKVTFAGQASATWHIEYAGERSRSVKNTGDSSAKTAIFDVAALPPEFRLVSKGPGDLTVSFVRVLKV